MRTPKIILLVPAHNEEVGIVATMESLALELSSPDHLKAIAPRLLEEAHAFSAPQAEYDVIERYDDAWHDTEERFLGHR